MEPIKLWYIGSDRGVIAGLLESVANDGGFSLDTFPCAEDAVSRMPEEYPDIVIVDRTGNPGGPALDPDDFRESDSRVNPAIVFLFHDDTFMDAVDALSAGYDLCWDALGIESALFKAALIREVDKKRSVIAARAESMCKRPHSYLLNETVAALVEGSVELLGVKEDLEKRNRELELVRDELEQFIHTVSHDLKEPLMAVRSFTQKLSENLKGIQKEPNELLRMVRLSIERMASQIDALLTFSRAGRVNPGTEIESLTDLIKDIQRDRGFDRRDDVEIFIRSTLPAVRAHPEQAKQIFGNLISNGIKYNRRDKKVIEIGTAPAPPEEIRGSFPVSDISGNYTLFYVSDNGIGLDTADRAAPFELFRRLSDDKEFEGDGAGLAIVKRAVLSLGGAIDYTSVAGKGTVMYFTLPHVTKTAKSLISQKQADQRRSVAEIRAALFND